MTPGTEAEEPMEDREKLKPERNLRNSRVYMGMAFTLRATAQAVNRLAGARWVLRAPQPR